MPDTHPMDLPEIRLLIAEQLDFKSLQACALVCKAWHDSFQPSVWRAFRGEGYSRSNESADRRREWLEALRRNAVWIQHFVWHHTFSAHPQTVSSILIDQCRSLVSMYVVVNGDTAWESSTKLICLNSKTIRQLSLVLVLFALSGDERRRIEAWGAGATLLPRLVADLPSLRRLSLHWPSTVRFCLRILTACPALEELALQSDIEPSNEDEDGERQHQSSDITDPITSPSSPFSPFPAIFPRLKRLELRSDCNDIAFGEQVLARCPALEFLQLGGMPLPVCTSLCNVLRRGDCGEQLREIQLTMPFPHPRLVQMGGGEEGRVVSLQILQATQGMKRLRRVLLVAVAKEDVEVLAKHHAESLESLDVKFLARPCVPGSLWPPLRGLVQSFPHLKTLVVDMSAMAPDLRTILSTPWVCRQLEVLYLEVSLQLVCKDPALMSYAVTKKTTAKTTMGEAWEVKEEREAESGAESGADSKVEIEEEWVQAERVLMTRLSELTRLKRLRLKVVYSPDDHTAATRITSTCWPLLMHLQRLQELQLGRHFYISDTTDLCIMKVCWPRLSLMSCLGVEHHQHRQWMNEHWPSLDLKQPWW
ncbi:hypothetical protein DFQ27_006700 [Actinomortierella ambigua]|uniref:F-box domain-containing protein n=1 Tax=Actinomortierella ambigua TaxID=1343610 RepID=A0A9P6QKP5_9FUNG|nr:hypothetical protein DFQ27_006700 [Actinomortierella ambigua]